MVLTMVIGGIGLARAVSASTPLGAIQAEVYGTQLSQPAGTTWCGADVVLLLDAGSANAAPDRVAVVSSGVTALARRLENTGARLSVISFDDDATVLTGGTGGPFLDVGAVTDETDVPDDIPANTETDPDLDEIDVVMADVENADELLADALGDYRDLAIGSRRGTNWEAAMLAAGDVLGHARPATPTLVVMVTTGPADRHQSGGDNQTLSPNGSTLIHTLDAVVAANDLKADGTRMMAIAVDRATSYPAEFEAITGPNAVVHDRDELVVPSIDDTILVDDPTKIAATLDDLGAGLCASRVTVSVLTNTPNGLRPAESAPLGLTLEGENEGRWLRPGTTGVTSTVSTDAEGTGRWWLSVDNGPVDLRLTDSTGTAAPDIACTDRGGDFAVEIADGLPMLRGVEAGADVVCLLSRASDENLLGLTRTVTQRSGDCESDGGSHEAAGVIGLPVTHCLRVENLGTATLDDIRVEAPDLDLKGSTAWVIGQLDPGAVEHRSVAGNLTRSGEPAAVATADAGSRTLTAQSHVRLDVVPGAVAVSRTLSNGADPCRGASGDAEPGAITGYCLQVVNTGGTYLSEVVVDDPALGLTAASIDERLAPGQQATLSGTAMLRASSRRPVARAFATDSAGAILPDQATVSSATSDEGVVIENRASETKVDPGDSVTLSMTVSNPGSEPLADVEVSNDVCENPIGPDQLSGDRDDELDPGEVWRYECTETVEHDLLSVATVTARSPASATEVGDLLTSAAAASIQVRRVDISLSKKLDNAQLQVGRSVAFRLEVFNFGPDPARNVRIIDPLPAGLVYDRSEAGQGSCTASGQTVTCNIGTLAATQRVQVLIFVTADESLANQVVINEADATTSEPETDTADNDARAPDRVLSRTAPTVRPPTTPKLSTTRAKPITTTTAAVTSPLDTGSLPATPARPLQTTTTVRRTTTTLARTTTTVVRSAGTSSTTEQALSAARASVTTQRATTTTAARSVVTQAQLAQAPTNMARTGIDTPALLANASMLAAGGFGFLGLARRRRLLER